MLACAAVLLRCCSTLGAGAENDDKLVGEHGEILQGHQVRPIRWGEVGNLTLQEAAQGFKPYPSMRHTARCKATGSGDNKHLPCGRLHTHCNGRTTQCTQGAVLVKVTLSKSLTVMLLLSKF